MRRVAIVSTSYPAFEGDPAGHFVETEARLLARTADVVVITAAASRGAPGPVEEHGVEVWRLAGADAFGWPGIAARLRERPSRLASVARWTHAARVRLLSLGPIDRIVAHWAVPSAFPIARAGASRLRVPLEIVSHGADVRTLVGLPALVRRRAIAALLEDATSWRFVSQSLLDDLARSLSGREAERLAAMARVEPAALDMPDVRARSSERKALHIGPLYALVGRLVPSKRFDKALEALAARGSGRDGSRVVVVGDGPERGRLEAQARRLGLDAEFVGKTSREEAIAWIGASDALVHASRTEGLSTVVREAETLGVPVELVG